MQKKSRSFRSQKLQEIDVQNYKTFSAAQLEMKRR